LAEIFHSFQLWSILSGVAILCGVGQHVLQLWDAADEAAIFFWFAEECGDCSIVDFEGEEFAFPDGAFFFQALYDDVGADDFGEVCFTEGDERTVIEPNDSAALFEQIGHVGDEIGEEV